MLKDDELRVGKVYDLEIKGKDFGRCLYLSKKIGNRIEYRHVLVRRSGECIFSLAFQNYSLVDNKLVLGEKRSNSLSPSQEEFLDERLRKAGL